MKKNKTEWTALIINAAVALMEVMPTVNSFQKSGLGTLKFYTIDSNLIAMVSSFLYVFAFFCTKKPKCLAFLRYLAAVNLTITFLVVVLVLAPSMGGYYNMMIAGNFLVHHTISPILTFISFVFLEKDLKPKRKAVSQSVIITVIYAVILVILNLTGTVYGPYPFLHVYEQSPAVSVLWFAGIIAGAYAAARIIYGLCLKARKG